MLNNSVPKLTEYQKNRILRKFNELRLQQKKATDALDCLLINKSEMLVQITFGEYQENKDQANWLYEQATSRLEKGLFNLLKDHPELKDDVLPYFDKIYSQKH